MNPSTLTKIEYQTVTAGRLNLTLEEYQEKYMTRICTCTNSHCFGWVSRLRDPEIKKPCNVINYDDLEVIE